MSQRILITAIALGLVLLAVGGWVVEAARWARAPSPLPPGKARRAFLGEGGQALDRVGAPEELPELLRFGLERARRHVDQALRQVERERALRGELVRRLERPVEHRIGDRIHQPDAQRLLRVDGAAREDQILRNADPADPREPLRATPAGDDAEIDLRLAELRAARRVAD